MRTDSMLNSKVADVIRTITETATDDATPEAVSLWLSTLCERLMDSATPDERYVKGTQLPVGIGPKADEYMAVREHRLAMEKAARSVKDRETELHNSIMDALAESTETGGFGQLYRVNRVEKDVTNVKDWDAFWAYVQKTGNFNLMQKRLNDKAAREMFEDGQEVPGVEQGKIETLSFGKI